MRAKDLSKRFWLSSLYGLAGWAFACPLASRAVIANVSIGDSFFSPPSVTINVNDQVLWTWGGFVPHSTTDPGVWDSGLRTSAPNTFSFTFTAPGNYPYFCSLHAGIGMVGSVTVQPGNVPPSVAITAPTNGATFAAPWTGTIQATASDPGGSVSKVEFFAGTTLLGTVTNPPPNPSFTVTNLAAGSHTLKAVATDNGGAINTSAGAAISVVTPVAIVLSAPKRLSASAFQFSYSANPGLRYVVQRSGTLPTLLPLSTNTATSNTVTFLDNGATGTKNSYRVRLAPNP